MHGAPLLLTVSLASSLALFFYGSCVVRTYTEKHAHTHVSFASTEVTWARSLSPSLSLSDSDSSMY